jgi:hypothetical protein
VGIQSVSVARQRTSKNEISNDASLLPGQVLWAGFSVVAMNLSLLSLDNQKPAEPWGQKLERLAFVFFDGDIGTEELS